MGHRQKSIGLILAAVFTVFTGCQSQGRNIATPASTADALGNTPTTTTPTPTNSSTASGPNVAQIIMATGSTASFDAASVPTSGGTYNYAKRFYDLKGNLISSTSNWWLTATNGVGVFLTSTSTSYPGGGTGATTSTNGSRYRTPCAYFDIYDDNNPESSGYYTIDGLTTNPPSLSDSTPTADIDQCAGITNTEKSKLGIFMTINRSYLNSTDKLQVIVKAKPLTTPNTAPVPSSCIVGGLFDASACTNTVFTITMRTALAAAARPFFMLFPSAKALDLISENVLLPINIDSTITTITIDRIKGGAVFYGITLVRVP